MEDDRIPKLPKIPFIAADVLLVITAIIIRYSSVASPMIWFWVIFCVALGGVIACLPFYVEFKNHIRLAEYDLSQANHENAERIETALAGIGHISQSVSEQTDRSERAASTIEGLIGRLDARLLKLEEEQNAEKEKEDPLPAMVENLSAQINGSVGSLVRELKAGLSAGQSELKELLAKSSVQIRESIDKVGAMTETQTSADIAEELSMLGSRIDSLYESLTKAPEKPDGNIEIVDLSEDEPEEETEASESEPEESTEETENSSPEEDEADETEEAEEYVEDELEEEDDDEEAPTEDESLEDDGDDEAVSFLSPEDEAELEDAEPSEEPEESDEEEETEDDAPEAVSEEKPEEVEATEEPEQEPSSAPEATSESEPEPEEETEEEESPVDQPNLLEDLPEGSAKAKKAGRKETSLIAQVLIGIGNKPYVRGEGPGLSPDKGVPMEFLEIGKWQWVSPDPSEPVTVTIYKNDQEPAEGEAITLEPGQKRIVTPRFLA